MDRVNICAECGAPLERVALVDLVVTYEPDDVEDDIFEQAWHRGCFVKYHLRQTSAQQGNAADTASEAFNGVTF